MKRLRLRAVVGFDRSVYSNGEYTMIERGSVCGRVVRGDEKLRRGMKPFGYPVDQSRRILHSDSDIGIFLE
jgi:hypothetical protein